MQLGSAVVLVYDKNGRKEKVTKGSYSDIVTYKAAKEECSTLFIQKYYEDIYMIVVYR